MAVEHDWEIQELLYDADARLSRWALDLLDSLDAPRFAVAGELMHELGGKGETAPELLAVLALPADDLSRVTVGDDLLAVVFDRPSSPGNIGTMVRSADAFGAAGVIVTGHAADVYDPKAVRASTGSLFSLPVVRVPSHRAVLDWADSVRGTGCPVRLVGTDEHGDVDIHEYDFAQPTVVVVGNETTGLSSAWREACDHLLRIPMMGAASSLNAAAAATVVLYESRRQRASHS
jgi:TrmH family RNA methyltransferase